MPITKSYRDTGDEILWSFKNLEFSAFMEIKNTIDCNLHFFHLYTFSLSKKVFLLSLSVKERLTFVCVRGSLLSAQCREC